MAYVYPEDRIVGTQAADPRPLNRTLGRYYGEFNGMLDRDNFYRDAFTDAKVDIFAASAGAGATYTELTGPCNHFGAWRSTTVQDVLSDSSARWIDVDDLSVEFLTQDSGLVIEASIYVRWEGGVGMPDHNKCRFQVLVDGVTVAETGAVCAEWVRWSPYLAAYTAVGAGTHTIAVQVSVYEQSAMSILYPNSMDCHLGQRELIVREVRR